MRGDIDPLVECLMVLGTHYGQATTREALVAGLPLRNQQLDPVLFARSARRIGLSSKVFKKRLNTINTALLPAILLLEACFLLNNPKTNADRIDGV